MAFDISNPIGTGTDTELLVLYRSCLASIAMHGQSYTIGKRTFTRADLGEVRDMITWLEGRIDTAASSTINYPTRRRAL